MLCADAGEQITMSALEVSSALDGAIQFTGGQFIPVAEDGIDVIAQFLAVCST
jgi:hypothetical protein